MYDKMRNRLRKNPGDSKKTHSNLDGEKSDSLKEKWKWTKI